MSICISPCHEDIKQNCSSNCNPRQFSNGASVGGDGGDDEEEIEGDEELEGEGLAGADGGNSDSTVHEGVEDSLESEGSADGSGNLGGDVGGDLNPGEVAENGEGYGEGGVEMRPGDVPRRQDHDHHRQPRASCVSEQALRSMVLLIHYWPRRCREYQDECSHELRSQLQCITSHHVL